MGKTSKSGKKGGLSLLTELVLIALVPMLILAVTLTVLAASFVLTIAVAFIPPFARAFSLAAISLKELAVAIGLALVMLPIVELEKFFSRREEK